MSVDEISVTCFPGRVCCKCYEIKMNLQKEYLTEITVTDRVTLTGKALTTERKI
jgi:hypothetical protein